LTSPAALPTPRSYLGVHRVDSVCPRCDHWRELDLAALIELRGRRIVVSGRSHPLE
jgi:hypothetical protein